MERDQNTVVRVVARPQFEGRELAVIDDGDREWFAAPQVSELIGHADPKQIAKNLNKQSYSTGMIEGTDYRRAVGGDDRYLVAAKAAGIVPPNTPSLLLLSRSGLDIVAMLSRTDAGRALRRWLADDVLPSIRRSGAYVAPGAATPAPDLEIEIEANKDSEAKSMIRILRDALMARITDAPSADIFPLMELLLGDGCGRRHTDHTDKTTADQLVRAIQADVALLPPRQRDQLSRWLTAHLGVPPVRPQQERPSGRPRPAPIELVAPGRPPMAR